MLKFARIAALILAVGGAHAAGPKAEVIHWWTSGGESAAVKTFNVPTASCIGTSTTSVPLRLAM